MTERTNNCFLSKHNARRNTPRGSRLCRETALPAFSATKRVPSGALFRGFLKRVLDMETGAKRRYLRSKVDLSANGQAGRSHRRKSRFLCMRAMEPNELSNVIFFT